MDTARHLRAHDKDDGRHHTREHDRVGDGEHRGSVEYDPVERAVTDAVILAPLVNGVTFVIGAEMTRRRLAERALETIMDAHPRFCAAVLNKVDFAKNKYYYTRYYGHQYKNYYAEAI